MKAKLLKSLRIGGQSVKPGTDDAPVIVNLSDSEFDRLAAMGAAAEATQRDLKLASVDDTDAAADKAAADKAAADKAAADKAAVDKAAGKKPAPSASDL